MDSGTVFLPAIATRPAPGAKKILWKFLRTLPTFTPCFCKNRRNGIFGGTCFPLQGMLYRTQRRSKAPGPGRKPPAVKTKRLGPPHIFERFYRTPGARKGKADGLGLGLSISHESIAKHQAGWTLMAGERARTGVRSPPRCRRKKRHRR